MKPLTQDFYSRDSLTVARELLGKVLVRKYSDKTLTGRIVEAEAYKGADDPASHAHRGRTPRNTVMFGRPGIAYVYFTYGNHHCLNVVTEGEGVPGAVLIRALEPLGGRSVMRMNRGVDDPHNLLSGPGKLTKALQITRELNGLDLTVEGELCLTHNDSGERPPVATTSRIGVDNGSEHLWRFIVRDSTFLSRRAPPEVSSS